MVNITDSTVDLQVSLGRGNHEGLRWLNRHREVMSFTYAQLADHSARAARVLLDHGIRQGDVVALLLPRLPDLVFAMLGAWKISAVVNPLLPAHGPGPIGARLGLGHAPLLITTPCLYAQRVAPLRGQIPELKTVLMVNSGESEAEWPEDAEDFSVLMSKAVPVPSVTPTDASSPALLHFTSGTTGIPKGVVHGHGVVLPHLNSDQRMFGLTPDDVYWCTAEPGWVPCTVYGIIAPLAAGAVTILDSQDFDPRRWYSVLVDEKVTVLYTTPASIRAMMRHGAALARTYRNFSLRLAASGGEPLNTEAISWGARALGTPFLDSWWQSETGAIVIGTRPDAVTAGSMGRPFPGIEVALHDRQSGQFLTPNGHDAMGELALRGQMPAMFTGYADDPDLYKACFKDGWYLTGDLVRMDPDGNLWFVGRCDDAFLCGGQSIGPFEVENALLNHPAVAETGVVGKPDAILAHIPVAFVTPNPGFEPGDALRRELLAFARATLGKAMAPKEIHFVDVLPKTPTGSIMRRALRDAVIQTTRDNDDVHELPQSCP